MLFKIPGFGSKKTKSDAGTDELTHPSDSSEKNFVDAGASESPDTSCEMPAVPRRRWPRILIWTGLVTGGVVGGSVVMLSLLVDMASCGGMFKFYEGRSYAGSMNRAQQAHYVEHGTFATAWDALTLGIEPVTQYHRLVTKTEGDLVLNYALVKEEQIDDNKEMKRDRQEMVAYVGAVALLSADAAAEMMPEAMPGVETSEDAEGVTTQTILCEAIEPGLMIPSAPQLVDGILTCASGTRQS